MSEKLLNCPFCGSSEVGVFPELDVIECAGCDAESSIDGWNTRTLPQEVKELIVSALNWSKRRDFGIDRRGMQHSIDSRIRLMKAVKKYEEEQNA